MKISENIIVKRGKYALYPNPLRGAQYNWTLLPTSSTESYFIQSQFRKTAEHALVYSRVQLYCITRQTKYDLDSNLVYLF